MKCRIKLILGMIFLFLTGCAGIQPVTDADRTFEKVFEAPGYSKEQIFNGTKIWIAENFKSAKAVLEYENKDSGTIIGNGIIPYPCSGLECVAKGDWKVPFTMRVDIKDQKFRLTFSNLHLSWPPSYDRTFGAQRGYDGPISIQSDLDAVRPELLKFGNQILASFGKEKSKSDW
jgi:hypothetical protein